MYNNWTRDVFLRGNHLAVCTHDPPHLGIWTISWKGRCFASLTFQRRCKLRKKRPGRRNSWGRCVIFFATVPKLGFILTFLKPRGRRGAEKMIQTWDILGLIACLVTPVVKSFEPSLGLSLPSQTFHPGVKSFHPRVGELKSMLRPSPTSEVARPIQNWKGFVKVFVCGVGLFCSYHLGVHSTRLAVGLPAAQF